MDNKAKALKFIFDKIPVNTSINISFKRFSQDTGIPEEELDNLLIELNNEGYITQFPLEGHDNFKINLNEKSMTYPYSG